MSFIGFLIIGASMLLPMDARRLPVSETFASGSRSFKSSSSPEISKNIGFIKLFLKDLLENTSAGYTLYGNKPIYLGNFQKPIWLLPGSSTHSEAVCAYLSLELLKGASYKNYYIFNSGNEFTIVNRQAFYNTVTKNSILFKHKFGNDVTPLKLFKELAQSGRGFSSLFESEIALQGIVLGYGRENSITYARGCSLIDQAMTSSPLLPPNKLPPSPSTEAEIFSKVANLNNSFKKNAEKGRTLTYYKPNNNQDKLKIPFGFHSDSTETKSLLRSYRKAQHKIERDLRRGIYCETFLKKFHLNADALNQKKQELASQPKNLISLLNKLIRHSFREELTPSFIEGMKLAKRGSVDTTDDLPSNLQFFEILRQQRHSIPKRRKNHQKSLDFLQSISKESRVYCLVRDRLYYRVEKKSSADQPNSFSNFSRKILAEYFIANAQGKILFKTTTPQELSACEMIPGLFHGIVGMKEGEVRSVFVHPDFAYGVYTDFANGQAIQIQLRLIQLENNTTAGESASLQPFDLASFCPDIDSCDSYHALQEEFNRICGMRFWNHYKKARPDLDLKQLIEQLNSTWITPLSVQEQKQVAAIDWAIYSNHD